MKFSSNKKRYISLGVCIFTIILAIVIFPSMNLKTPVTQTLTTPTTTPSPTPKTTYTVNDINMGQIEVPIFDYPLSSKKPEDFTLENGIMKYSGESLLGIDVSEFQGGTDWAKVKASGVDFAMLRLGYSGYLVGDLYKDSQFENFVKGASENDIEIGAYFFSQAINTDEAIEEAEYVIQNLEPYKDLINYPIVFDWEFVDYENNRTQNISGELITEMTLAFCETIEKAGYKPMLYGNKTFAYYHLDLSKLNKYPLWVAEYTDNTSFYYDFDMWQYTEKGNIDGVPTPVDVNISFVDFSK